LGVFLQGSFPLLSSTPPWGIGALPQGVWFCA